MARVLSKVQAWPPAPPEAQDGEEGNRWTSELVPQMQNTARLCAPSPLLSLLWARGGPALLPCLVSPQALRSDPEGGWDRGLRSLKHCPFFLPALPVPEEGVTGGAVGGGDGPRAQLWLLGNVSHAGVSFPHKEAFWGRGEAFSACVPPAHSAWTWRVLRGYE